LFGAQIGYQNQLSTTDPETDPLGPLRMTIGLEGEAFLTKGKGFNMALLATVEGEKFGVSLFASYLSVAADDGTDGTDSLQQLNAHLTYAFLSGSAGRLRGELGVDTVFAQDMTFIGPTIGISGSLWQLSPIAFEGALNVTPVPYLQVDGRAGIAYGIGALGIRAGYRVQMLDDRGLVDGVVHRDYFGGPYVGLSIVL
jgi:hypothetical protein